MKTGALWRPLGILALVAAMSGATAQEPATEDTAAKVRTFQAALAGTRAEERVRAASKLGAVGQAPHVAAPDLSVVLEDAHPQVRAAAAPSPESSKATALYGAVSSFPTRLLRLASDPRRAI
jgi:hypothetical protein